MKENMFSKILLFLKRIFIRSKDAVIEDDNFIESGGTTNNTPPLDESDNKDDISNIDIPIIIKPMEKTLKLVLERIYTCSEYTIGHLYANGEYVCDTLEDCDRNLNDKMSVKEITDKKVYGETAIPVGIYDIDMDVPSPKYSNFEKYKWAKKYDGKLPRLQGVKGFEGVLIHVGNYPKDTLACLLVGLNKTKGALVDSTNQFNHLMDGYLLPAKIKGYKISVEIKQKY